ncbi:MAG: small multi-drug export protein [Candidatus Omnitrophica bacterium]|nr:small multi-drug export protein [Candidatus Omnitrophota bacterium]
MKQDIEKNGFQGRHERNILLTGLGVLLFYSLWVCVKYFLNPEEGFLIASFSVTRLLIGNPAGVFWGYAIGFNQGLIVIVNMIIDTIVVFILYPLLVLTFKQFLDIPMLKPFKRRFFKNAEIHLKTIKRYGALGLFLFVLFPLWGTGPVAGSIIGFLMKLRPWINMSIVLSATYFSTVIYSIVFKPLHGFIWAFDPKAPMFLILVLLIIIISIKIVRWLNYKRKWI